MSNLRPWKPGQSGNPKGRPKGIGRAFREALTDPTEAALDLLEIAHGRVPGVRAADRIAAWRELLDRGYGKAPAFAAMEGYDPLEMDEVAAEIQSLTDQLLALRQRKEAPEGAPERATG